MVTPIVVGSIEFAAITLIVIYSEEKGGPRGEGDGTI